MMGFNKEDASKKMNIINAFVNVLGTFPGMYLVLKIYLIFLIHLIFFNRLKELVEENY